jgi:hypothetical protein
MGRMYIQGKKVRDIENGFLEEEYDLTDRLELGGCKKYIVLKIDSIEEEYPDGYRRVLKGLKGVMFTREDYEDLFDVEDW